MDPIIRDVLAALGGGAVVLGILVAFGKEIIKKSVDVAIETAAQKSLKKLENQFARNMSAYEILLRKEFDYYESIDSIYSELISRVQDCCRALSGEYPHEHIGRFRIAKEELLFIGKSTIDLKSKNLKFQPYIPHEMFMVNGEVTSTLDKHTPFLFESLKKLNNNEPVDDIPMIEEIEKDILMSIAQANVTIHNRLRTLSEG